MCPSHCSHIKVSFTISESAASICKNSPMSSETERSPFSLMIS